MTFKLASLSCIVECVVIAFLCYKLEISWSWSAIPLIPYIAFIIYGSANIKSNFYTKVHCSSITTEKQIAITFDDGPHFEFTPKILSTLHKYNSPATFFVIGKNIQGNENLIRKIDSAGHTIGNHTFSHSFFIDFKGKTGFMVELDTTSDIVYDIIKKRMNYFRPPYGVTTPHLASAAKALKYEVIGWNIRSLDTTKDTEEKIANRVISQVKPGAIILFHDTSEKTAEVLKQTLNFAKENGFKIVSVEELLKIKAYS